jgi:cysteine desulfurase
MRRVYLDNNATTPVLPEVFETMQAYFGERFGNASSIHHHGQETRAAVGAGARVGSGAAGRPRV